MIPLPLALTLLLGITAASAGSAASVTTQHVDNARTGAFLGETALTPDSVRTQLQRAYQRRVDGQTLANPLFVGGVSVSDVAAGDASRNLFYVATANNCVYAFDLEDHAPDQAPATPADHCDTSARAVWHRAIAPTGDVDVCAQTDPPRVGVTSTPVIDLAANAMFVVSFHADDHQHYLHELDIRSGADLHAPVRIAGSASGQTFQPACHRNRPGLLLQNGVVYLAFASLSCDRPCGAGPYRGWVFGYRAADLLPMGVLTTAAKGGGAGIWQSGAGLAGDGESIYAMTGNDRPSNPLGDSFLRIAVDGADLAVAGRFTPANAARLKAADNDLGSGGPTLLPGGKLLGGGKEGALYLVDSAVPGRADQQWLAFRNTWHDDPHRKACQLKHTGNPLPQNGCYMPPARYQDSEHWGPNIHTAPVYWKSAASAYGYVYMQPEKEYLRQFRYDLDAHRVETAPFRTGAERAPDGMPGAALMLSADGDRNGVVWALVPNGDAQWTTVPGHLVAYDAETLATLWRDDDPVAFAKFNPPLAVDGHVIRPTFANTVIVYALAPETAAETAAASAALQPVQPRAAAGAVATSPLPCYDVAGKYAALGGAVGIAGTAAAPAAALDDAEGGTLRLYAGFESLGADCDAPVSERKAAVPAAVVWSPRTCAHLLRGTALALWEAAGAQGGSLGYPLSDEVPTADGAGRHVEFEGGEIVWTLDRGYRVVPRR